MAEQKRKTFSGRAFASTLSGISFLGMCITGIILFVVPPGRIANWTGWTILGLTTTETMTLRDIVDSGNMHLSAVGGLVE